jgi:hypothetical protein
MSDHLQRNHADHHDAQYDEQRNQTATALLGWT